MHLTVDTTVSGGKKGDPISHWRPELASTSFGQSIRMVIESSFIMISVTVLELPSNSQARLPVSLRCKKNRHAQDWTENENLNSLDRFWELAQWLC